MVINLEGKEYHLMFRYDRRKGKPARATHASLKVGDSELASTTVRLHSDDVPCKENARKFALAKLLQKLYPSGPDSRDYNKEMRTRFWHAYHLRKELQQMRMVGKELQRIRKENQRNKVTMA